VKKRPSLRDQRGAAETAARDYAERHRHHDPHIEINLMAGADQTRWKIVAHVEEPNKIVEMPLRFGTSTIYVPTPVFPLEWKDHEVVVRKRTR
jgi:hypothetical protein